MKSSGTSGEADDAWADGDVAAPVFCLLAPNPGPLTLDGTNTWVICPPTAKWAVVVDPGPNDERHLAAIQQAVAVRGAKVASVLLTHGHRDHSAGAAAIAQSAGCDVLALDQVFASEGARLAAGDSIDVGSTRIEVVATPGHSSDSVSFLIRSQRLLLTGDTVLGRGTSVVAYPDGTLAAYLDSLRRLLELAGKLPLARVLPGHGAPVGDPQRTIAAYLRHRSERLEQIETALAGMGVDREELVTAVSDPVALAKIAGRLVTTVYAEVPESVRLAALSSVLAQLEYLAAQGSGRAGC